MEMTRTWARRVLLGWCWAMAVGLCLDSFFHLACYEPRSVIVGMIAVTPWVYMLAWATAAAGLFWRRRALAVVSLVLVGLQLWWVVPDFDPISHLVPLPRGASQVRLFDANVSQANHNMLGVAGEIRRNQPAVVTMQELTPRELASLRSTGVMASFRYRLVQAEPGSDGMALWSKFPLEGATTWYAAGHLELRAWLLLPNHHRLRLDVLHTLAPYLGYGEPSAWASQLDAIAAELKLEPRPLVAVGDLNATWYDFHFQDLLSEGFRDAAVVAGQGWRMTWPRDQAPVVPYLRIDHVLLSPGVSLQRYSVGPGAGSDHHSMFVWVGVGESKRVPS